MLTEIDHVAIAVNDLDAAIEYYPGHLRGGARPSQRIEKDGVDEALIKVADSSIQLLTPTRDDSPVAKFLAAKGEGSTTSATGSTASRCPRPRRRRGSRVIDEGPAPAAGGPVWPSCTPGRLRHPHRAVEERTTATDWLSSRLIGPARAAAVRTYAKPGQNG